MKTPSPLAAVLACAVLSLAAAAPALAAEADGWQDAEQTVEPASDAAAATSAEAGAPAPEESSAPSAPRSSVAQSSSVKVKIGEGKSAAGSVTVSATAKPPAPMGLPPYNVDQHKELDLLTTLNQIEQQKFQRALQDTAEKRDRLSAENAAAAESDKQANAAQEAELKKLQLAAQLRDERQKAELAPLAAERDKLKAQNDVEREKLAADQLKADEAKLKIDVALRELDYQDRKLKYDAEMDEHKTVALKSDLDLRGKKEEWKKEANKEPDYPLEPFKDGVLTVSDRRITLDGPIISGMADYVTERIHYFNNKDDTLPIFIVIDKCPGGSVMEGYRIVKAIQTSKAPVHVVVKSFAASMAAVITTLAPHSYAYPNAIILHHQLFAVAWGNPTELKDQMKEIDEWYHRLAEPVAKKMGLTLDEYTKEMYKHNSDGDWSEFADKAQKLHWVDHLVGEIRETGMVKEPEGGPPKPPAFMFLGLHEEKDPQGNTFVRLPRLDPGDAYWIHNPDHYYR